MRPETGGKAAASRPGNARLGKGSSAGSGSRSGSGASRSQVAGKVTPQRVNDFLSLRDRSGTGARANLGRDGTRVNSRVTNINNSFNRLNVTQIRNINTNINRGFRNPRGIGFNRGFGFNSGFGFGFGNPFWNNWAFGVRGFWNPYRYFNCFTPRFWATNFCNFPWQRSYYWWGQQPWSYWWNTPTWNGLCNWFPNYGWSQPYYYGYGSGGNIIYNDGQVYVDDQPIATVEEYAASAAELAEVPPPADPDAPTEWMPLGTFALSEGEADKDPNRVVQLAVDKDGIISGTMTNQVTKQTLPIQGRVDKDTQRVAFTIGDTKDVVFETGIYNLTQKQTPVLVHGEGREETYLMLRLEQPKENGAAAPAPVAPAPAEASPAPPVVPAPMVTPRQQIER